MRPDEPLETLSLEEQIFRFNQEIFAFEDKRVNEINTLILTLENLQAALHCTPTTKLLSDSLSGMMDAENFAELSVFKESFLAALELSKMDTLIDLDACIEIFRETAKNIFELDTTNEATSKEFIISEMQKLQLKVEETVRHFYFTADKLQNEFQNEIDRNNTEIALLIKKMEQKRGFLDVKYFSDHEQMTTLKEKNIKYEAGLKRIRTQTFHINHTFDIIKQLIKDIPNTTDIKQRQHLRADFAINLQNLQELNERNGYNYFLKKTKALVESLYQTRSSYLEKDESFLKSFGKSIWLAGKSLLPFQTQLPYELPNFTTESASTSAEIKSLNHVKLGKRTTKKIERRKGLQVITHFLKQAVSVVLGASGLVLSAMLCLTAIGIPKALLIAQSSVSMLNTVREGSDIFSENIKKINHTKKINSRLNQLEQDHEKIRQALKMKNENKMQSTNIHVNNPKPSPNSETKIDLLLMGHKPHDILSQEELEQINRSAFQISKTTVEEKPAQKQKDEDDESDGQNTIENPPTPKI